jgi:hypothetical protein
MFAGDAYGLIFGGWSDASAALRFEWQRQAFEISKAWEAGQRMRLWGFSGVTGAPSWREVVLTGDRDKGFKMLGIRETTGQLAGKVEAHRLAPLEVESHRLTVEAVRDPRGAWALCGVTYREPEGLEIVGGGILPSPLTVNVKPGWLLLRADSEADDSRVATIRELFATYPGWREHSDDYDPNAMLAAIARLVGEQVQ